MRSLVEIKTAYDMCQSVLGGKSFVEYTSYDRRLRFQRSALRNCYEDYQEYVLHKADVLAWLPKLDQGGADYQVVADTWRWCLGINDKLPVKFQRQR